MTVACYSEVWNQAGRNSGGGEAWQRNWRLSSAIIQYSMQRIVSYRVANLLPSTLLLPDRARRRESIPAKTARAVQRAPSQAPAHDRRWAACDGWSGQALRLATCACGRQARNLRKVASDRVSQVL